MLPPPPRQQHAPLPPRPLARPRRPLPAAPGAVTVLEHRWGEDISSLGDSEPFEFVFGCDLMYVDEAVPDLVASLRALAAAGRRGRCSGGGGGGGGGGQACGGGGGGGGGKASGSSSGGGEDAAPPPPARILLAHGRNRGAEPAFLRAAAGAFSVSRVPEGELDPRYQCSDVDVLSLTLL
jgi:hypothetical protein